MNAAQSDFANVVRVPRFHQAPQRIQHVDVAANLDNVIVLPVIRLDRHDTGPPADTTLPD